MAQLRVVGFDPSLTNWGIAAGVYYPNTKLVEIEDLQLGQPVVPKGKQVRQNSKDLAAAEQLMSTALSAIETHKPQAIFVEVPVGSQSARAMASYGICVGILGALRASGTPFFELTPVEVKLAAVGDKKATKQQMIDWAMQRHPKAPWPMYRQNGERLVSSAKAEHMADAVATIYAGVQTPNFQQFSLLVA